MIYALVDFSYCDKICDTMEYLMKKSGVLDIINHNFARIRIDSYDSLSIENILTSHVIIVIIHYLLIRVKMNTTIIYFTYFIYIYIASKV